MHAFLRLICLLLLLPALPAKAAGWTPETLPMVHLQDARRYVCNPDKVLSQAATDSIDYVLGQLEREKGIESVAVVVKRLEGDNPYDFGMKLARKYGIGNQKSNTGLILILAVEDRSYQILTGRGLEGTLPDAICRRIENRIMVPALREGQWDTAMLRTVQAIDGYIRGDDALTKDADDDRSDRIAGLFGAGLLVFGIILTAFAIRHSSRKVCPKCGKRTLRKTGERPYRRGTQFRRKTYWCCSSCGHKETHDENDPRVGNIGSGGMFLPPFIGGTGTGRGFGGGSFGGGSFGGGGSGGRF